MSDTKLFDDWNVQLAKTYKSGMLQPDTWLAISQKINGVRATYFSGGLVSRTGHKIIGFHQIENELAYLNKQLGGNYVFDGELRIKDLYAADMTDNEAFKVSVGIANTQRSTSNKNKLQFIIFDVITLNDFVYEQPTEKYSQRWLKLQEIDKIIQKDNLTNLKLVPFLYVGSNVGMIEECSTLAYNNDWEGVMINLDTSYQYKRTGNLLKYKKFNTIDLRVIGFTEGTGKYEGTLGAVVCRYKNNYVSVGSGFTDAMRHEIWFNKEYYQDRLIEVKYKDITSDSMTGLESLQFPVFMGFKVDKTQPDA